MNYLTNSLNASYNAISPWCQSVGSACKSIGSVVSGAFSCCRKIKKQQSKEFSLPADVISRIGSYLPLNEHKTIKTLSLLSKQPLIKRHYEIASTGKEIDILRNSIAEWLKGSPDAQFRFPIINKNAVTDLSCLQPLLAIASSIRSNTPARPCSLPSASFTPVAAPLKASSKVLPLLAKLVALTADAIMPRSAMCILLLNTSV